MESSILKQTSILVVDDDAATCKLLESVLAADGYTVRVAASGEETLAAVAQQLPDLILLDILLPGIDGLEVTRRLKADSRSLPVPIILVTLLEDRESRLKGLQAGANEFLSKPVDYTELLMRVKNQLKIKEYTDFLAAHNRILEEQVRERTAALRASEEKFRTLYESSLDAIMTVTSDEGFLGGNPAAIALFGCRDEREFTALTPTAVSPEFQPDGRKSADKAQEMMRLAMENGSHFFEWTSKRVDGSEFPAEVLLARTTIGGKPVILATVRDITARKRAEAQLNEQLDELRRWHEATLGREMRSLELKREVNDLLKQAGQPPRYSSAEPSNEAAEGALRSSGEPTAMIKWRSWVAYQFVFLRDLCVLRGPTEEFSHFIRLRDGGHDTALRASGAGMAALHPLPQSAGFASNVSREVTARQFADRFAHPAPSQ